MKRACAFNLFSPGIPRGTITHIPRVFHVAVPAGIIGTCGNRKGKQRGRQEILYQHKGKWKNMDKNIEKYKIFEKNGKKNMKNDKII